MPSENCVFCYSHSIRLDGIAITNHRVLRGADELKGEVSVVLELKLNMYYVYIYKHKYKHDV